MRAESNNLLTWGSFYVKASFIINAWVMFIMSKFTVKTANADAEAVVEEFLDARGHERGTVLECMALRRSAYHALCGRRI